MILKAQTRDVVGKQVKTLRAQKMVPASVYGPNLPTRNLTVNEKELRSLFRDSGYSKLFDLEIAAEKPIKALLKEVQVDHMKGGLIHVSIYAVDMAKTITTSIPVRFEGVSLAVKNNLGLLVTAITNVMVSCLPDKLPKEIVVDINKLDNVGDAIFLKDLNLPAGVNLISHAKEAVVASIASPQKSIEEETPVTEAVEGAEAAEGAAVEGEGEAEAGAKGAEAPATAGEEKNKDKEKDKAKKKGR